MQHRNVFIRKLAGFGALSADDQAALARVSADVREYGRHEVIVAQGDAPRFAHAVLEGVGCRYKLLPDGSRQILDFLLPGDLGDGHALFKARMDHWLGTLTPCRVACIAHADLLALTETRPAIARALWWTALVQESIAREWIANVGRRQGAERMAHLLCELCHRLDAVGLSHQGRYRLGLTQIDLADATGLSAVHANRMIQQLRADGLIVLKGESLTVPDLPRLEAFCGFDAGYLHLRPMA